MSTGKEKPTKDTICCITGTTAIAVHSTINK